MTRTLQPEDLFRLKFVQDARFSPDGATIVYVVSDTRGEKDKEKDYAALWLMSLESAQSRQLTNGQAVDSSPRWSPDGKQIAFLSTRGEKPQIYSIAVDGGEARALTRLKQGVQSGPEWSPDGKRITFTAGPDGEPRDPAKPYRVDRIPYRFDNMGYLDDLAGGIYIIDAEGGEAKQLMQDRAMKSGLKWSPDGEKILFSAVLPADKHRWLPGLRVVDLNGKVSDVVWEWGSVSASAWMHDSRRIAFIGVPFKLPPGTKSDLWMTNIEQSAPECRTAGLKVGVGGGLQDDMPLSYSGAPLLISNDGKQAYTQLQESGMVSVYRVALEGAEEWEALLVGERTCMLVDIDRAERHLLYNVSTLHSPTDLYVCDIEGANERQMTTVNSEVLAEIAQPEVENLKFPSSDGTPVEGWIMKPPQGEAPYPTILYIHGGPYGAFGHVYSFDFQMLAGAGYAVLFINYRGSTGYGSEFATDISGRWGGPDYEDHMAGIDHAIAKGITDPERLGVCGLSAGGFGSCNVIGRTRRFKAAVPENPVTSFLSLYGVSDIGPFIAEVMGGKPYEVPDLYAEYSPITRAHTCTTPTLLIQGEADYRCPAEQSEQFYSVLKDNGCIVEMLRLPNSPHGGSIAGPPIIRRAHNDALLEWMNRYLLGKS